MKSKNRNNDKKPTWGTPAPYLFSRKTSDFLLYADDTNIEYNDISEILPKLQTYKETAEPGSFIINWGNVFILVTNKHKNKYKNISLNPLSHSATSNLKQKLSRLGILWIQQTI